LPVTGVPDQIERLFIAALVFIAVGVAILAGAWALGTYLHRGDDE
jgi:hypothetical protein